MTSESIGDEFNHVSKEIDHLIQAEIRRLKLLGYSKAHICERSLEIQDWAEKEVSLAGSSPHFGMS
jgi:hypothetical protein